MCTKAPNGKAGLVLCRTRQAQSRIPRTCSIVTPTDTAPRNGSAMATIPCLNFLYKHDSGKDVRRT